MNKSDIIEMPEYFDRYINLSPDENIDIALQLSLLQLNRLNIGLIAEKALHRYEPSKWTVNEVFQHIIDAERIFAYRALRFSRNDKTELHGFEENDYAPQSNANNRNFRDIIRELIVVRQSTMMMFDSFSDEQMLRSGIASEKEISVLQIGYTIIGHQFHHIKVLEDRYFN